MKRLFSPVEQAYLSNTKQFTKAQQRYIRYRLKKKLRLIDESRDAAAAMLLRLDNTTSLVAQPVREKKDIEIEAKDTSPSRDLNPGPKVYETFALPG